MSHSRLTTTYQTDDGCGGEETHTLYAHLNHSCDVIDYYDENGEHLFSVDDCVKNNMVDAINKLMFAWEKDRREFREGVRYMTLEESAKCGLL